MTVKSKSLAGASTTDAKVWNAIDWRKAMASVKRLQMRIAKAERERRHNKVKALQWLLTHSYYAKVVATKRVTSNRGSNTPGIDGITCKSPQRKLRLAKSLKRRGYRAQPLRRIYIPKKHNSSEQRPLSIPTIKDRAMQALHLLALEPIAENWADPNAYGFRSYRSTADAIEQCFRALCKINSSKYVLEGDIRKCFDSIDHDWLKTHIPMDKRLLSQWLSAGYMEKHVLYSMSAGTPQGGIISPCLAVMTLSGLEGALKCVFKPQDKIHVVTYADDFIVTGASPEVLEQKVKPVIKVFLQERGLALSETKTQISHINEGFDFLGFNIRKYKGKLLIKPSKSSINDFLGNIRRIIKQFHGMKTLEMIKYLNCRICGWGNYNRHVVSKDVFNSMDDSIYRALATCAYFTKYDQRIQF